MTCETLFFYTATVEIIGLIVCSVWLGIIAFSMFLTPFIEEWKEYWKAKQYSQYEELWQLTAKIERLEKQIEILNNEATKKL